MRAVRLQRCAALCVDASSRLHVECALTFVLPTHCPRYADYGRWAELWVDTARAQEALGETSWVAESWPQVKLMAQYMLKLRANATTSGVGKGLIYGPAEHDTCRSQTVWFSTSAWTWRGFVQLSRFLTDTAAVDEAPFAETLKKEADAFKVDGPPPSLHPPTTSH